MQEARALSASSEHLAILVGPVLGTVLVLGLGAGEAFALDAATFLVSAALLARVTPRPRGRAAPAATSVWKELRVGWIEVRSRPWVWVTIAAFTGALLCAYAPWYSLAPIIARDRYGGAGLFGVLESVAGARGGRHRLRGRHRFRVLAVRDLVGGGARALHPARCAVARQRL